VDSEVKTLEMKRELAIEDGLDKFEFAMRRLKELEMRWRRN
jgi:hypothetical protein